MGRGQVARSMNEERPGQQNSKTRPEGAYIAACAQLGYPGRAGFYRFGPGRSGPRRLLPINWTEPVGRCAPIERAKYMRKTVLSVDNRKRKALVSEVIIFLTLSQAPPPWVVD